ncbi:outer membrane beta-barrel protein [Pontimicrobium sp. MEBiC01747]
MKNNIITLLVLLMAFISNAQEDKTQEKEKVTFGVTAGFSNMALQYNSGQVSKNGFFGGVNVDFLLSNKLHIQPSLLYTKGDRSSFLKVPVMLKYYVAKSVNVQLGPEVILGLDRTFNKAAGLNLGAGLGYDLGKRFFIEGRYSYELTDRTYNLSTLKYNNLTIGFGYKF